MNLFKKIPRTVFWLGLVSFFSDFSSEMIYPLLPLFLATALGASTVALGVIEGVAESTASLLKVVSGLWTDKVRHRKPLIVGGYSLASLVRPLIGLTTTWPMVLLLRFTDRVGKGLRTSPRDALIADVTESPQRATAYGFHRAMDHAGSIVGPLVAAALMGLLGLNLRQVFLWAALPAVFCLLILFFCVKEPKPSPPIKTDKTFQWTKGWQELSSEYKYLLLTLLIFTLGNSTDAFLIVRLTKAGVAVQGIAILWALHHVVKMLATYFGGKLSDHIGHRIMIVSGWVFFALIYASFAIATSPPVLIGVFLAYGIYFGLVEPAERALVAGLVPAHLRGTAFGYYHFTIGLGALPASLLFGLIWKEWGVSAAFLTGAGLAITASLGLGLLPWERHRLNVR